MKESKKYLLWLLLLYCLVRLPLLLSHIERPGVLDPAATEDAYVGTIAKDFIHGLKFPVWDYIQVPYGGGVLIAGLWTVPFFYIFGDTLFAFRLAPFCWHLLSLVAWFFVWQKHFSPKQAFFILLFLVLPPPNMTIYMLINKGFHFEMILWMALSILIFRRFLDGRLTEIKAGLYLGLLGGFSSFTVLTNLVTVAVLWIYLALTPGLKIRKSIFYGVYILGFLIGFSPLIIYNFHVGWDANNFIHLVWSFYPNGFFHSFIWFYRHSLRMLFDFPNIPTFFRHFFMDGYTLFYSLSMLYLLWYKRKVWFCLKGELDIETFGLFFQILLFCIFMMSGAYWSQHHLFPIMPFVGMTLVVAGKYFCEKVNRKWGRWLQWGLVLFCVTAGIWGNLSSVSFHTIGQTFSTPFEIINE